MRGRKPLPPYLKIVTGTARGAAKKRRRELESSVAIPPPPAWLPLHLHAEHRRIAVELYRAGIVSALDGAPVTAFVICEELVALIDRELRRGVDAGCLVLQVRPTTPGSEGLKRNPLLVARAEAIRDWLRYAAELGLTPSSRARIPAQPPADHSDPSSEFF